MSPWNRQSAVPPRRTPETLVGRKKVTDATFVAVVDQMVAQLRKDVPQATSTAAGFYGDPAQQDMVMIAAVSGPIGDPDKQLNDAFTGIGTSGLNVSGITSVDPGALGGAAKCGTASAESGFWSRWRNSTGGCPTGRPSGHRASVGSGPRTVPCCGS